MTTPYPFLFTFNLRRSIYQHSGSYYFGKMSRLGLTHIPVVNNLDQGVEARGKQLSRLVREHLDQEGIEKCHLVSYSLSGIDARYALSQLGLDSRVNSLTTVATPHLGCRLAWLAQKQVITDRQAEPIARLLGVGLRSFWEITRENMHNFNARTPDSPHVQVLPADAVLLDRGGAAA